MTRFFNFFLQPSSGAPVVREDIPPPLQVVRRKSPVRLLRPANTNAPPVANPQTPAELAYNAQWRAEQGRSATSETPPCYGKRCR